MSEWSLVNVGLRHGSAMSLWLFKGIDPVENEVHFLFIFMQLCIKKLLYRIEK